MLISVRATAAYDLPEQTFLLLMVEPPLVGPAHRVEQERLLTTPTPFHELGTDVYGNPQRRIIAPQGSFSFEFTATIETAPNTAPCDDAVEHPLREIPAESLVYTLPSRYCQSDLLARMRAASSVNSRPVAGESGRSPTGSAITSSTTTGRPTPRRRRSIRRRSESAYAAISRIWSSPSAGRWAFPPAMPRAMRRGWSRPIFIVSRRSTSAGHGTTSMRRPRRCVPP